MRNIFLILISSIILHSCAKNFNQVYIEYETERNQALTYCNSQPNATFTSSYQCYSEWNRQWGLNALKNGDIDAQRHLDFEYNRRLQSQGMIPISQAMDAGKLTNEQYNIEVQKVNKLVDDALAAQARVREAKNARAQEEANRRALQALQILGAYGNAMRANTPQQPQNPNWIIPPQDLFCYYNNC